MVKKALLIGFVGILLLAIPLTIYILTTQTTQQKSNANPASNLSLVPQGAQTTATVGTPFPVNLFVDPSGDPSNPNKVSFIKIAIQYDGNFFSLADSDISVNTSAFPVKLDGRKAATCNETKCALSVTAPIEP